MTSLYSDDIILFLFKWIKQSYKNKYLVTGDWSQSIDNSYCIHFERCENTVYWIFIGDIIIYESSLAMSSSMYLRGEFNKFVELGV